MTTEERLAKLEKGVRVWRGATLGMGILTLAVAGFVGFQFVSSTKTLRSQRFEVVDSNGTVVTTLYSSARGGVIDTRSSHGRPLFTVTTAENGDGVLDTFNAKGEGMVSLGTTPTGGSLRVFNNLGKEVVGMQSNKMNSGLVMVKDVDGVITQNLVGNRR